MAESETVRASFTAVWSEPHYVALVFPANVEPEIKAALDRLALSLGGPSQNTPQLDFDWRVVSASTEVGRGSGRERPTRAFFGSLETGLAFGGFAVNAGQTYELEVRRGPAFEPFAHAVPLIEVGVNSPGPSLGLLWVKEFSRPIAVILAAVGLAFLGGAAWSMRERAG